MTNYGTIKIPQEEYERHNEQRKEAGLTWLEYLNQESATIVELDQADVRNACEAAIRNELPVERLR